ncbi:MAG: P1 family peptidase [Lachnospira sp.]
MYEISIKDIEGVRIGQTENEDTGTGCTVILCDKGMAAGLDIRGGGPASRESGLMDPLAACQFIHGVVLAGGSAYGLDAAGGVMTYLEEHGIGLPVGNGIVPLVCQSDIFDLTVGDGSVRPDKTMGYKACVEAETGNYRDGNYGAGCGATVGKLAGMEYCMKSGIGSFAVKKGDLIVGAVVAVNALGDIFDYRTGQKIAGLLNQDRCTFADARQLMYGDSDCLHDSTFAGNTTIGAVITNARFNKSSLCKIAGMAHDGYARSIAPVHTTADGDSIYALSIGEVEASQDMVGSLAADVCSEAVIRAIKSAKSAYGFPAFEDIMK